MKSMDDAEELARSLVTTANDAGCKCSALITDMNQPLAKSVGNALELMEVMEALGGEYTDTALCELTCELGGELLVLAGMAKNAASASAQIADTLTDGSAAERFGQMVAELGGPADFVDRWRDRLPAAPIVRDITAERPGFVTEIDGEAIGQAVVHMGGGRLKASDRIDPSVGFSDLAMIGDDIDIGAPLGRVHAADDDAADRAEAAIRAAYLIGDLEPDSPPLVYRSIR